MDELVAAPVVAAQPWLQGYTPVADSLALSFWVALMPVLVVFVLLGGLKRKVHVASA